MEKEKFITDIYLKIIWEIGGSGDVFKVEKQSTKKKMVIKVIRVGKEGTDEFNQNLKVIQTEIEVGIKLGNLCKFLVQLTEFFMEEDYCCLVMEFCSGGDLQKIFDKKNRLSQPVFLFFFFYFILFYFIKQTQQQQQQK